jgi:nucleotide-binding universal stress UspA family protein
MKTIKKILVPTDLSELSIAAADYAASLALTYGAKIYMLYVVERESRHETTPVEPQPAFGSRPYEEEGKKELHRFVYWKLREVGGVIEVVRVGKAETEIRRFAEEEGIDLIVMATHGRTGLAHVLMGSVAEKVVRLSSVPVMTVKPESCLGALITEKDVEEDLHLNV